MDLDHVNLFINIARERSITRAAELNGVSQSAASQHVHELERSLDVKLLDRSTRPLTVTPAGQLYYEFCRDVVRRKEEFTISLEAAKREIGGVARVACIYSIGLAETLRWEEWFRRYNAGAELSVQFLRPERVYEAVRAGGADLGLLSYPEPSRDLKVIPWRKEVMLVAARPDHPLAENAFLTPNQLDGVEFISFDDDLPIAREIRRYLRDHGVDVNPVMSFDNVLVIKEAVAMGSAISILPERSIAEEIAQERLVGIPLESPGFHRPLGIIHLRRKKFSRATQAFLEMLERRSIEELAAL